MKGTAPTPYPSYSHCILQNKICQKIKEKGKHFQLEVEPGHHRQSAVDEVTKVTMR